MYTQAIVVIKLGSRSSLTPGSRSPSTFKGAWSCTTLAPHLQARHNDSAARGAQRRLLAAQKGCAFCTICETAQQPDVTAVAACSVWHLNA